MSQSDVLAILNKHKSRWLTATEIANMLKANRNSISTNITKLKKSSMMRWRMRNTKIVCRQALEYKYKK